MVDVEVHAEQLGYHLRDAGEWWEVVWNSGLRLLIEQVPGNQRERLQVEHLEHVASLVTTDGLWMDCRLFSSGVAELHRTETVDRVQFGQAHTICL